MKVPKIKWIPFDRYDPPADLDAFEDYLVLIRKQYYKTGVNWTYHVDIAEPYGEYLDNFWDTRNDWDEGQVVEVVAYAELPTYLKERDLVEE